MTYEGNKPDCVLFKEILSTIKKRLVDLGLDINKHTLVFDKGNNSKNNFKLIDSLDVHYVSSLVNNHHKSLPTEFFAKAEEIVFNGELLKVYRCKKRIHGKTRVVIVYISEALREGQEKGILDDLKKKMQELEEVKIKMNKLGYSREEKEKSIIKIIGKETVIDWALESDEEGKLLFKFSINENKMREKLNLSKRKNIIDLANKKIKKLEVLKKRIESSKQEESIRKIIKENPIEWEIKSDSSGISKIRFSIDQEKLKALKDKCGFRILVTDRDEWETAEIIHAYHGQAVIENEFKNLKNPMHLSCRPQFHWTDQKIRVHFLICMIGHMLSMLLYKEAKEKLNHKECLRKFLDDLASIRLCSVLKAENSSTVKNSKTVKVEYSLEEVTEKQQALINAFNITPKTACEGGVFPVGVY